MNKLKWFLDFYKYAVSQAVPDSTDIYDLKYTFKFSDISRSFVTIEDTGYKKGKDKKLERYYWNKEIFGQIKTAIDSGQKEIDFKPHGEVKARTENKTKEPCIKLCTLVLSDKVDLVMYHRASEVYKALGADLWFFKEKVTEIAEYCNLPLGELKLNIDHISMTGNHCYVSQAHLKMIKGRTNAHIFKHMKELVDAVGENETIGSQLALTWLTYFLVKENPTPTFDKIDQAFNAFHDNLTTEQLIELRQYVQDKFRDNLKSRESRRKQNNSRFLDIMGPYS